MIPLQRGTGVKATVEWVDDQVLKVVAYEKGDQPDHAVDVPAVLLNAVQRADHDAQRAREALIAHLMSTGAWPVTV